MEKVAPLIGILTISAAFMATCEAESRDNHGPDPSVLQSLLLRASHITCILEENCTLPCHYEGNLQEVIWNREDKDPMIKIIIYPKREDSWENKDYKGIVSLSLSPGDAALLIHGVQRKHKGLYHCKANSSSGNTDRLVYLKTSEAVPENRMLHLLWILLVAAVFIAIFLIVFSCCPNKLPQMCQRTPLPHMMKDQT